MFKKTPPPLGLGCRESIARSRHPLRRKPSRPPSMGNKPSALGHTPTRSRRAACTISTASEPNANDSCDPRQTVKAPSPHAILVRELDVPFSRLSPAGLASSAPGPLEDHARGIDAMFDVPPAASRSHPPAQPVVRFSETEELAVLGRRPAVVNVSDVESAVAMRRTIDAEHRARVPSAAIAKARANLDKLNQPASGKMRKSSLRGV